MLGTWHTLSTSPVLTHFRWSSLVLDAVKKNASLIHPALSTDPLPDTPIAGLMVVHVRRGDYAHHYKFLANCSSDYMGWCKTPGMSDTFNPPGPPGVETEEKNVLYEAHGFPNAKQIGKRVHEITKKRQDWDKSVQRLRNLYIMTNGDPESINEVKRCIEAAMGLDSFDSITSSLDLILDNEQRYVNIAIDQAVAERAEVFVGNGVSYSVFLLSYFVAHLHVSSFHLRARMWCSCAGFMVSILLVLTFGDLCSAGYDQFNGIKVSDQLIVI